MKLTWDQMFRASLAMVRDLDCVWSTLCRHQKFCDQFLRISKTILSFN
jgi:hypothetical protein